MVDKQSTLREMALFAGAGGGILGGHLLGWKTVCAVEWDIYAACVLAARQNDGILPSFPIWDDVQSFDGTKWRGLVDVVSGGFPCQDISAAGLGAGIEGNKSSMWKHMARIIGEVRPRYAYVENSPMLTFRGLGVVLADLSKLGYDCKWGIISAASVGAPHLRERIWLKAEQREFFSHSKHNGDGWRQQQPQSIKETSTDMAHTNSKGLQGRLQNGIFNKEGREKQGNGCATKCNIGRAWDGNSKWWNAEPDVGRVAHGVACRVDRLKAIGNGQVSSVAATAWSILNGT